MHGRWGWGKLALRGWLMGLIDDGDGAWSDRVIEAREWGRWEWRRWRWFLVALVLRSEREKREGLSEGVGFYKSCAYHLTSVDFFRLFFLLFFSFLWVKQPTFRDWDGYAWPSSSFPIFFIIFSHFSTFIVIFWKPTNKIQSNKNMKIIIITRVKQV